MVADFPHRCLRPLTIVILLWAAMTCRGVDAGEPVSHLRAPDGFRVDVDGNLWCGWGMGDPALDGVMIFNSDGRPIGRIALPERCANVCFGGRANSRLFMAASHSVYALYVNVAGVAGG